MKHSRRSFDVIVIGGGHAGCEAAHVAHRIGASVGLITHSFSTVGAMSCNPAMGGVGKGHLIREIDALDGLIGRVADEAGIHFRLLNRSRGPAVQGPRVQCDREVYKKCMQREIRDASNICVIEAEVDHLILDGRRVKGVNCIEIGKILAKSVIIAAGTFLNGRLFLGDIQTTGGRHGDKSSTQLAKQLLSLGFKTVRLKTGTPARLASDSINFTDTIEQAGDSSIERLSFDDQSHVENKVSCYITQTSDRVHDRVRRSLNRSAIFNGAITSLGPRYCPSLEDKIVRFHEKASHTVFLEPETVASTTIYPNGLSTSLPLNCQIAFIRDIVGLEFARLIRAGFAIEYETLQSDEVCSRLSANRLDGLFFAGQVLGTTGYEEAAALGIVAGISAVGSASGNPLFTPENSYIGVLISKLIERPLKEPLRIRTSLVENRLSLRADNADRRMFSIGEAANCLSDRRKSLIQDRMARLYRLENSLREFRDGERNYIYNEMIGLMSSKCSFRSGADLEAFNHEFLGVDFRDLATVLADELYRPLLRS